MNAYRREELILEEKMINKLYEEISGMKFSFRKIRKVIELDALVNDFYK
ncbi:MAG: hypothetical protein J1E34_07575 [Oscillospiraceae bacterium]|nr:hypothetical protein [Oscillospiraceae bacterium]